MGNISQRIVGKNISQRIVGKRSARVMLPDGVVVEYDYCIQVAMLMTLHPDHFVIHYSSDTAAPGDSRQINVMDLEDRLRLGQTYIMYPIPPQHKEMFKEPPVHTEVTSGSRSLNLKLTLARWTSKRTTVKRTKRRRLWRRKIVQATSAPTEVQGDGGWVPLLNLGTNAQRNSTPYSKLKNQAL